MRINQVTIEFDEEISEEQASFFYDIIMKNGWPNADVYFDDKELIVFPEKQDQYFDN